MGMLRMTVKIVQQDKITVKVSVIILVSSGEYSFTICRFLYSVFHGNRKIKTEKKLRETIVGYEKSV